MPSLQSADSQDNPKHNLVSLRHQPAAQILLPAFSGTLNVDEELKLNHENFKQSIDNFCKDNII
jgi:hypothetical protein